MAGWRGQTALITGASGGIGLELARCCARSGFDLVLVARTLSSLERVAGELGTETGVRCTPIAADLSRVEAPAVLAERLRAEQIMVEVLINNAGFGLFGPFATLSLQEQLDMVQVNVTALTHLTRLFLPEMIDRRSGRVLNVASTAAFQPGPLMAVYYATKAYVLSLSEALGEELRDSGVTVTALCPGPTATGFQQRAELQGSRLLRVSPPMDAGVVAQAGFEGMMRGKRVVVPGLTHQLQTTAVRFLPRNVVTRLARLVQERTHA
jgi:short-subunit dehydrogenase